MLLILAIITFWAFAAVTVIGWMGPLSPPVAVLVYAFAGIVWIAPLKPILVWMETGRWR